MTNLEDEIKNLREKNNELVQTVQYWKVTAAQRENEKLELMKENNGLRLKLSRLRSGGAAQIRKLDTGLQSASEEALNHLVHVSSAIARTIELTKNYIRESQELNEASPKWSSISGTPNTEKVHRVPPMMGGQSIQPVVSLSRTIFNTNVPRSGTRSPNQNRNVTERAVPMHMLQDVYIPLTRIDVNDWPRNNAESDDLMLEGNNERSLEESHNVSEEFDELPGLDAVTETTETENELSLMPRESAENPLEGPSWLLDDPARAKPNVPRLRVSLEPDSTTEFGEAQANASSTSEATGDAGCQPTGGLLDPGPSGGTRQSREFTPTVRRRKRGSSPVYSPRSQRRSSASGRVLKVMVAKMRLEGEDVSPPKRPSRSSTPATVSLEVSPPCLPSEQPDLPGSPAAAEMPKSPIIALRQTQDSTVTPAPQTQDSPVIALRQTQDLPVMVSRQAQESPVIALRQTLESPTKMPVRFDAPSPNGSTDARVIVSEVIGDGPGCSDMTANMSTRVPQIKSVNHSVRRQKWSSHNSRGDSESDSDSRSQSAVSRDSRDTGGRRGDSVHPDDDRVRRLRRPVNYKEKPLNRKMRR